MLLALLSLAGAESLPERADPGEAEEQASPSEPEARPVGGYVLPLISYDSNLLLGLGGAGLLRVRDATGEQPFLVSVSAQYYWTTGGYRNHYLLVDWPGVFGSRVRIYTELRFIRWSVAPYYGLGNDAPIQADVAGWHVYDQKRESWRTDVRVALSGPLEAFGSYSIQREQVDAAPTSQLALDRPVGIDGGRYAWLQLGMALDTRDNEIDPNQGWFIDASARASHRAVGSQFDVLGLHVKARHWQPLHPRVIWAHNSLVDWRWGDEPFFNQPFLGGLGRASLGGRRILRGLGEERFRGDGVVVVQEELRVTVWTPQTKRLRFEFQVVPFVDVGRVFLAEQVDPLTHWHPTVGAGLRMNANELVVLRADVGVGFEEFVGVQGRTPQVQVYILSDHPF